MKIYLAGPSRELPRIVQIREALTNAGHVVTSRWINIILEEGSEHDKHISEERLRECAEINLYDLSQAEMMVYVVEHNGGKSVGAGVELGYQLRGNRDRIVVLADDSTCKPTLFALLAHRVDSMDKLLAYLEGWETSAREHERAFPCSER